MVKIRELYRDVLEDFQEEMRYGGPCYSRNGVIEAGFASQKHFIGVYFTRIEVLDAFRDLLKAKGVSIGKSYIRYSKPEHINFETVGKMLKAIAEPEDTK